MKKERGVHLKSIEQNFQLQMIELEWRAQATTELPQLNPQPSLKLLHKLLIHNIYKIKHISLPNGTKLMSPKDFQIYYKTPTKLEKNALHIAEQLFCHPSCNQNCPNPCNRHPQIRTLKTKYISNNRELTPRILDNPLHPPPQQIQHPNIPSNIKNNLIRYPIHTILNHKSNESKDKYKITKKYTTYLYQWSLLNNITYNKWLPQSELFPLNHPPVIEHNIKLLKKYYTRHQYNYYNNIVHTHLIPVQSKDPRFIPEPTRIPHLQILVTECNPEKDITTTTNTIQTQNELAHIYEDTGRYLITIPTTRLK